MNPDHYYTIEQPSVAEFKDRGSQFIAYAFPINKLEDFKERLTAVRKEHPKASHHCFAYRLGTEGNIFRSSDDGEPSGTAGKPILGQIDSKQLTNVLIVVVRYFGGTLLGVPGLLQAYRSAASLALETRIIQKPVLVHFRLEFDYTLMNKVMRVIKQFNCEINKQEQDLFCLLEIGVPKSNCAEVLHRMNDLSTVAIHPLT